MFKEDTRNVVKSKGYHVNIISVPKKQIFNFFCNFFLFFLLPPLLVCKYSNVCDQTVIFPLQCLFLGLELYYIVTVTIRVVKHLHWCRFVLNDSSTQPSITIMVETLEWSHITFTICQHSVVIQTLQCYRELNFKEPISSSINSPSQLFITLYYLLVDHHIACSYNVGKCIV